MCAHQRVETRPEGGNSVVFFRHSAYFFKFAVENVGRGEQVLKALFGSFHGQLVHCVD